MAVLVVCVLASPLVAQRGQPSDVRRQPREVTQVDEETDIITSMEFVETDITSIFKVVSDLTGWSVVMSPALSENPPRINLWIKDMTADQVLDQVAYLAGIVVDREDNVVRVMTFAESAESRGLERSVISLRHSSADAVVEMLQPFADQKDSRVLAEASTNQVVLLAPPPLLGAFQRLVERLDVPTAPEQVRLVKLEHASAARIAPRLQQFLQEGETDPADALAESTTTPRADAPADGDAPAGGQDRSTRAGRRWLVQFMVEPQLNVIVLRGLSSDVDRAAQLVKDLDVAPPLTTVGYQLRYTNVEEVSRTMQSLVEAEIESGGLHIAASQQNNRLVVDGSPSDHERVRELLDAIDQPLPPGSGGSRVYRLDNASANEVAGVLQDLINGRQGSSILARRTGAAPRPAAGAGATGASGDGAVTAGDVLPASITPAPEINAVLIRASAAEHEQFAALIEELDQPRDQVLLEVTLVSVRSDDAFRLGVELSGADVNGVDTDVIGFSSFGIADVDSSTGRLSLSTPPPFGANLGIFRADDFSLVLNALRSVGSTRITSAPRVLVLDNTPGQISQVNEEPFEALSQSDGTLVRSFGGFVEAGTTLVVTPHVSQDDWLRLEYEVNLSAFGTRTAQQLAANLPPPRRESASQGTVRLPSNHIVVIGGMRSTNDQDQEDRLPWLGEVPVLGELFKSRRRDQTKETLYIFIRPVVLRDRGFEDLIHLSTTAADEAGVATQTPQNPLKLHLSEDGKEMTQ